jgi:hypothetical protein
VDADLRRLERAHRADPQDLVALRELADERKRRGEELLPDRVRLDPWTAVEARTCVVSGRWIRTAAIGERDAFRETADAFFRSQLPVPAPGMVWVAREESFQHNNVTGEVTCARRYTEAAFAPWSLNDDRPWTLDEVLERIASA